MSFHTPEVKLVGQEGTFHVENINGTIRTHSNDFFLEVAKGNIPGHSAINQFGRNSAATAGEDIWCRGGAYPFYPTSSVSVDIVSSADADNGGTSTGAIQVVVQGLDGDWAEVQETVVLDGTNPVQLNEKYVRLHMATVYEAGTGNTNAGNITVYARETANGLTAGDVGAYIEAGKGHSQQAVYTVPANKTAYFVKGYVAMQHDDKNGQDATFLWLLKPNNGVNGAWIVNGEVGLVNIGSSSWQYEYGIPAGPIPEKTDIRISLLSTSASSVHTVGGIDILLVEDGY